MKLSEIDNATREEKEVMYGSYVDHFYGGRSDLAITIHENALLYYLGEDTGARTLVHVDTSFRYKKTVHRDTQINGWSYSEIRGTILTKFGGGNKPCQIIQALNSKRVLDFTKVVRKPYGVFNPKNDL